MMEKGNYAGLQFNGVDFIDQLFLGYLNPHFSNSVIKNLLLRNTRFYMIVSKSARSQRSLNLVIDIDPCRYHGNDIAATVVLCNQEE